MLCSHVALIAPILLLLLQRTDAAVEAHLRCAACMAMLKELSITLDEEQARGDVERNTHVSPWWCCARHQIGPQGAPKKRACAVFMVAG